MKCPFCNVTNVRVIDTRHYSDIQAIRRRRECKGCKKRFSTIETIEQLPAGRPKKADPPKREIPVAAITKTGHETRRAMRDLFLRTKERMAE